MTDDFPREALRRALEGHRPDRTAMLNRIAANRAAEPRPRGRAVKLAGSALAVLVILGLGGVAGWAMTDGRDPTPAAPPATPSAVATTTTPAPPTPSAPPSPAPSRPATSRPHTEAPAASASPVRGHPGDTQEQKGSLWSDGSVEGTGDSVVTLKPGADLTELDLTIRVTRTPGLTPGGFRSTAGPVTATVTERPDAVLYHFTLAPGATLKAGEYRLTARWSGGPRDAKDDTYEAYATSVEHKRIHIYGNFFPKN